MAEPKQVADWAWKIFTVVLSVIIIPLAGWVWSTNVQVSGLRNDLGDLEEKVGVIAEKVEEADANSKAIVGIQKDIQYMNATLGRIERAVAP